MGDPFWVTGKQLRAYTATGNGRVCPLPGRRLLHKRAESANSWEVQVMRSHSLNCLALPFAILGIFRNWVMFQRNLIHHLAILFKV